MSKRIILAVAFAAALALPAAAVAQSTSVRYERDYQAVAAKFGSRAPGRDILRHGLSTGSAASASVLMQSIAVLERMLTPAPALHRTAYHASPVDGDADRDGDLSDHARAPATRNPEISRTQVAVRPERLHRIRMENTASTGGAYSSIPGVPAGFAACVATRESSNGAGSSNIYGIIPGSGYNVAGDSVAQQKQVFAHIYHTVGASAWSKYDGC